MKNKILDMKKRLLENRKRAVAYLLVGSLVMGLVPMTATVGATETSSETLVEANDGNMNIVPYNNEDIRVDVASGGWATPVAADVNGDEIMDLILGSNTTPYPGTLVFYGQEGAQQKLNQDGTANEDYMFMENAVKLGGNAQPNGTSFYEYNTETHTYGKYLNTLIIRDGTVYGDAASYPSTSTGYGYSVPRWVSDTAQTYIEILSPYRTVETISGTVAGSIVGMSYAFADYDGDGKEDYIYSAESWGEYGWRYDENGRYDVNGVWGDGDDPIRSWVFWHKNEGSDLTSSGKNFGAAQLVTAYDPDSDTTMPLETFGSATPQFRDWDADGDLDIICGSFLDDITYFENNGDSENPQYIVGRPLQTYADDTRQTLEALEMNECNLTLTSADWNEDGYMDLIVCVEDGRVALIEHSGTFTNDGKKTPIMENVKFFQMPAEGVKGGMEFSPFSVDWDGDGDEDIISGNSYGYICFIENLSIDMIDGEDHGSGDLSNPSWAKPVPLRNASDDSIYRITAGDTLVKDANGEYVVGGGSPQGTSEDCWGYTTLTVADWDGDNVLDIISNNVWGKVYFHRGIDGDVYHVEDAQPVEVEWENGNVCPSWNWWKPEGKELVTVWRTTPFAIDLPLDKDGDGTATGDGLVDLIMLDHEGYLTFFERYESSDGTLKLKEGKRIFQNSNGGALRLRSGDYGENGRVKFTIVDYDMDGMLDIIYTDDAGARNVEYARNMSTTPGEYVFSVGDMLHERAIYNHSVSPTVCNWNKETDEAPDLLMGAEDGHMYYLINNVAGQEDEEVVPTPDDYLVAHWDFEGNDAQALQDKSSKGVTTDTLNIVNSTNVSVSNGKATISGNGALQANDSDDLDLSGEMTIFVRAKFSAIEWYSFLSKHDGYRGYALKVAGSDYQALQVQHTYAYQTGANYWAKNSLVKDEWKEMAVVIRYGTSDNFVFDLYVSNGEYTNTQGDFTLYSSESVATTHTVNDVGLVIGNSNSSDEISAIRTFDDVRIYRKALTPKELAELVPDTSVQDSLVAHWDFEDDGTGNTLQDKATEGTTSDDLTIYDASGVKGETEDISIQDGVATIKSNASLRTVVETEGEATDLDITGELTLLMKVKVDALYKWSVLASKGSAGSAYWLGLGNQDNYGVYFTPRKSFSSIVLPKNEWREVAAVVNYNSDGNMVVAIYVSNDSVAESNADYQSYSEVHTDKSALGSNDAAFIIGNALNFNTTDSTDLTRDFDDVRIYNKALTAEQLAGVYAEDKEDSSLVAHWDFNGTDETTQLADKANGENPLSIGYANATPTGAVTLSDGKATITGDGYLRAAADGLNITDSMTVFVRAKVDSLGWYKLLNKRSGGNGYELGTYPTSDGMMLTYKENFFANNSIAAGEWREMAIVVNKDEDGFYNYEFLMSKNEATADGGDFVSYVKRRTPVAEHVAATTALTIGNNGTPESFTATRIFDDIQIYNRALTTDELAALIEPTELTEGNDTTSYYLESLNNNAGFTFFEYRTNYTAETIKESVTITPVAEDQGVVIKVNGTAVDSGTEKAIALVEGSNTVTITVGDGTNVYRTYTLSITRNSVMVDKLATLVERVGKYENTGYDAWDTFEATLAQAEALIALTNPSDGEVTDVYNALVVAEEQLFAQENLPAVSLKGFKHVTLEDFGLTSKAYTSHEVGQLSTSLDNTIISFKVDFDNYYYTRNRIDIGCLMLTTWSATNPTKLFLNTTNTSVIPDSFSGSFDLSSAGISSSLDEFLMQISFEYKDYDGDGTDDGMQVNVYANGTMVYTKDMTGCAINNFSSKLQVQQSVSTTEGYTLTMNSVIGDAHADGTLDARDLVAVVKKANGTDLGNTYENTAANVNMIDSVDDTDATALRSKLVE